MALNTQLSPYSRLFRPALVADAMITAANLYPKEDVVLMPILDTLALLVQQPLCFTFFRRNKTSPYKFLFTTLHDPNFVAEFAAIIRAVENGGHANLIHIPETDICLCIHCIRPEVKDGHLKAEFPELNNKDAALFKRLFEILHKENSGLGRDVLVRIGKSCSISEEVYPSLQSETNDASYWAERRRILGGGTRLKMIEAVRSIVDGAVTKVSESSLLRQLGKRRLPFENIFCVYRSATNLEPRCTHFLYDAQLVLSSSQRAAISKDKNFGESIPALMELPLGATARSIADSVFCSGLVDFSDEQTGQGRDTPSDESKSNDGKRQSAELKVYGAIAKKRHVFYVPIHVSGVPWIALFTISPKSDKNATWAHNYAIYRSLVSGVAEIIRTQAKSTYLNIVKNAFLDEYRIQDKASFKERINHRWDRLLLYFPFPGVWLVTPSHLDTRHVLELPDIRPFDIQIYENPWYRSQISYDHLDFASIRQVCMEAITELKNEARTARLEWEAQEHTIFNVLPTNQIEAALSCGSNELSGAARRFVAVAKKKTVILETSLTIPFLDRELRHLREIGSVLDLVNWLKKHAFSGENEPELTLPPTGQDIQLRDRSELASAFTLFWNLWSNASKTYSGPPSPTYWIIAEWREKEMYITFKNAGEMPADCMRYLLHEENLWHGPGDRKGLIIIKSKLKALGWRMHHVNIESGFTSVVIVATNRTRSKVNDKDRSTT